MLAAEGKIIELQIRDHSGSWRLIEIRSSKKVIESDRFWSSSSSESFLSLVPYCICKDSEIYGGRNITIDGSYCSFHDNLYFIL